MFRVKHVMTAWLFLIVAILVGVIVVAPILLMFLNGAPSAKDFGNYLFLLVLAFPIGIILALVTGIFTFPIALLLCASDRPMVEVACFHCGYDLTGNETGRCPECGATASDESSEGSENDSRSAISETARACRLVRSPENDPSEPEP